MDAFRDKVALITGGASGIGRALGAELTRRGARVDRLAPRLMMHLSTVFARRSALLGPRG